MRAFFITAATIVMGWFLAANGQLAFLHPGSQLGFLETRIEGPASEMMRRSPELRANFDEFRECYLSTPRCDTTEIFAERDALVKKLWPETYSRLAVTQDWDVCDDPDRRCETTDIDREDFLRVQAKLGADALQNDCVLVVNYRARQDYFGDDEPRVVFDSGGYLCDGKNYPFEWDILNIRQ